MGISSKRKKEKNKDFQKPKLKVGKAKPKASNFTDTSFKAKSISITSQSLSTSAPSNTALFTHHLSLLGSKSIDQRRDSLSALINLLNAQNTRTRTSTPSPQAPSTTAILPKLQPLLHDPSKSIRHLTLKLLQSLPRDDLVANIDMILLYVRAGMTHLAADVRVSNLDVLEWLVEDEDLANSVVSAAGGWGKTLSVFAKLLGWKPDLSEEAGAPSSVAGQGVGKGWTASQPAVAKNNSTGDGRLRVRLLVVVSTFLRAGLHEDLALRDEAAPSSFPLWNAGAHRIPSVSRPYAHLNLFGTERDDEGSMYEDRSERQRFFAERWKGPVEREIERGRKEGGEVGRVVGVLRRVIETGLEGFEG